MKTNITLLILLLFSIFLIGCTTAEAIAPADEVATRVTESTLSVGSAIPVPADKPLVTITGAIGTSNQDGAIVMDRAALESVGLFEYSVKDPFEQRDVLFRGVLMSDLMDLWEVDEDVTVLKMVALNDYSVDVPIEDLRNYPVLFALEMDGETMEPDYRGPAMLVYPFGHYEFDEPLYERYWIWQIKSIEAIK